MSDNNEDRKDCFNNIIQNEKDAFNTCRENVGIGMLTIWPVALQTSKAGSILASLSQFAQILYSQNIRLNMHGAELLLKQIHLGKKWWEQNLLPEVYKRFQGNSNYYEVNVILFKPVDVNLIRKWKKTFRPSLGLGKASFHVTDPDCLEHLGQQCECLLTEEALYQETLRHAKIFFNSNTIHRLNFSKNASFPNFDKFIELYSQWISAERVATDKCCIDNGAVLAAYGIRDVHDLDFLYLDNFIETKVPSIDCHNMHFNDIKRECDFSYSKNGIIMDPGLHFYYHGMKMASLDVTLEMKRKRLLNGKRRRKDVNDVYLIEKHLNEIDNEGRLLIVMPEGGLGNRLRTIAIYKSIADYLGRKFYVYWHPSAIDYNTSFTDLFEDEFILSRDELSEYLSCRDTTRIEINYGSSTNALYDGRGGGDDAYYQDVYKLNSLNTIAEKILLIKTCVKFYPSFIEENIFDELVSSNLAALRPLQTIIDFVDKFVCENFNNSVIGLHARRTDRAECKTYSPDELFISFVKKYQSRDRNVKFYLATDSMETEQKLKNLFGDIILTIPKKYNQPHWARPTTIQEALIEMLLLSKTKKVYGSIKSSFGYIASKMGCIPFEELKIDLNPFDGKAVRENYACAKDEKHSCTMGRSYDGVLNPLSLLTAYRFDIPAKYIYAKYREKKIDSNWHADLYKEHLAVWNNFIENGCFTGQSKRSFSSFINDFNQIIDSIRDKGFDRTLSRLWVDSQKYLLNGGHRLAAAILFNKKVYCELQQREKGQYYCTWDYFRNKTEFVPTGLSIASCDAIALQYVRLKKTTFVISVFPRARGHDTEIRSIIANSCHIVYEKRIRFGKNGLFNFIKILYQDEQWIGNYSNGFVGIQEKTRLCSSSASNMLRIFLVECNNVNVLRETKKLLRKIFNVDNHSVHINDTHVETVRAAEALFNSNSVHFLEHATNDYLEKFDSLFTYYRKHLQIENSEDFCITGKSVIAAYGITDVQKIEYLHHGDTNNIGHPDIICDNESSRDYSVSIDDIIYNPLNHFYYSGCKFLSYNIVIEMMKKYNNYDDIQTIPLLSAGILTPDNTQIGSNRASVLVSILILNFNGGEEIRRCLSSIERNTPEAHEIIIVDNASTDDSIDYLRSKTSIILVENQVNLGCPPARAQAMAIAKGNYIVLLDNDAIVTNNWLTKFIEHALDNPEIGIMGPRSNYVSGPQIVPNVPYQNLNGLEMFAKQFSEEHQGRLTLTHRIVGFCMFIRREVIDKIGSIDASFGKFGFEDDDYTWRAQIAGFSTTIADDIFIHHTGGPQGLGNQQYNRLLLDAWEVFKKKWGLPEKLQYGAPHDVGKIIQQSFDLQRHYIQPLPSASVKPLIHIAGDQASSKVASQDASSTQQIIVGENITCSKIQFKKKATSDMVSIIIPVTRHAKQLKKCIENIRKHTPERHEIIFVENSCNAGILKWIGAAVKRKSNYSLIKVGKEAGQGEYYNLGMEASSGEYIVLLYKHVIVTDGWLSGMLRCINRAADVGIVGPMTNAKAAGRQCAAGAGHVKVDQLEEYTVRFLKRNRHRRVLSKEVADFCMLFRRSLVDQIGPFDDELEQGSGCDDYCLRAAIEGYENVIAGDVFILCGGFPPQGNKRSFAYKWRDIDAKSSDGERLGVLNAIKGADKIFQEEEVDKAIVKLLDGLKYRPDEEAIYHRLAEMLIDCERFKDGFDAINSIPEDKKKSARTLELTGYCKAGLELYDEAAQCADHALSLNPSSAPALNLLGVLAHGRGDKSASKAFLKKAIASDPGYGVAYTNLGILMWEAQGKEDALEPLEKGFILSPTDEDSRTAYLSAISETGEFQRAEGVFREAKALYPNNRRIAFLLIDILIRQEKHESAMQDIREAMNTFGINDGILSAAQAVLARFDAQKAEDSGEKPGLSLCMIVKDEEDCLARCLMSAIPVVNEIVIVDTGSTDRTKKIAKAFGARIYDFEWTDDFSEARNFSLAKTTGDWILLLDADEVISPLDYDHLTRIVKDNAVSPKAYLITTRNYVYPPYVIGWTCNKGEYVDEEEGTGWYPSRKVRLFPNNSRIRFENPVHEFVESSLKKIGIETVKSDIPVHHYGQLDRENYIAKGNKYYPLGKKKLEGKGEDLKSLIELAVQAGGEFAKYEEAVGLWKRVLQIAPRNTKALVNLGAVLLKLGKYEAANTASKMAMTLTPGLKEAVIIHTTCEVLIGDVDKAIPLLEGLLKEVPGYPLAISILAAAYGIEGENGKGLEQIRNLQKMGFRSADYLHELSESLISAGKTERAVSLLEFAVECGKGTREIRELLDGLLIGD